MGKDIYTQNLEPQDWQERTPPQLTPAQKRANWWHYHWVWVAAGVAALALVATYVFSVLGQVKPDYVLAYVGAVRLPDETAAALETQLAALGQDLNGDGRVVFTVDQYLLDFTDGEDASTDAYTVMAASTQLMGNLEANTSYIFLLAQPAEFEQNTGVLAYRDGSIPAEDAADWEQMTYRWGDCPTARALNLGQFVQADGSAAESQTALENFYLGRRFYAEGSAGETQKANEALWAALTQGAE